MKRSGKDLLHHGLEWAVVHRESLVDAAVLLLIVIFLTQYFDPGLLLSDTTATGGDTPGHVLLASYLKNDLIPSGQLIGWYPYSFAGQPLFQFYFFLPYLFAALASFILPFNIAFKLSTVAGIFLIPLAAYASARLIGFRFPTPSGFAIAALFFLFREGPAAGGTIKSSLSGQFAFTLSIAFLLLALGGIYRGTREPRSRKWLAFNVLAISAIVFSHVFSLIPLACAATFFVWEAILQRKLGNIIYLMEACGLAFLFTGFWSIPFFAKQGWSVVTFSFYSASPSFAFLVSPDIMAAWLVMLAAIYLSGFRREQLYTAYWAVGTLAFMILADSSLLSLRMENVFFLLTLLSSAGVLALLERRPAFHLRLAAPIIILILAGVYLQYSVTDIPGWIKWNYSGMEAKPQYPDYAGVTGYLRSQPIPGRIDFEYSATYNDIGSPRVFELSPQFHGKPVMEGLLLESSITYPFFYFLQKEISNESWWPGFNLRVPTQNLTASLYDLWLFNVHAFVAVNNHTKELAAAVPQFVPVKNVGEFTVYSINQLSQYVEVLAREPVLVDSADWKSYSYQWMGIENRSAFLAFDPSPNDDDAGDFHLIASTRPLSLHSDQVLTSNLSQALLESRPIARSGCVIEEKVENQALSFNTTCPGLPHIIKMSYYPNWQVVGARRIYLLSPSSMLVFPLQREVTVYYGWTLPDLLGTAASALGLLAVVLLLLPSGIWLSIRNRFAPRKRPEKK